MPALANFLNAELVRRGWTKKDFAKAVKPYNISQSAAYFILAGNDNVQRETQESIALALGMTPADLAVAVYRPGELAAHQVAASTAIEQMPPEKRPVALEILWGLAGSVPPTQSTGPRPTRRNDAASTRGRAKLRQMDDPRPNHPTDGQNGAIDLSYVEANALLAFLRHPFGQRVRRAPAF